MLQPAPESARDLPSQPMLLPHLLHFRSRKGPIFILTPERTHRLRLPAPLARQSRNLSFFSGFERGEQTRYDYQFALQEVRVSQGALEHERRQ